MGFNGDLIGFGGDFMKILVWELEFVENFMESHGQNIVVALFREIPSLIWNAGWWIGTFFFHILGIMIPTD